MAARLLSINSFKSRIRKKLHLQDFIPVSFISCRWYNSTAESPIKKILIANRGEIACRVIRSTRKMGIQNVACYSDADENSLHTLMADEAFYIGQSPASNSYLCMEKIIDVAKKSKAEAIHPGYGFLSEKPEFANLCEDEGIIFIGPPSTAIRDMGIKSTSKHIMSAANVPIIHGYHGEDQNVEVLQSEAEKIGYPVMLKAVRGGGGKGMRIVMKPDEFKQALESAKNESIKAFGDDKMLVEKFVERPRHVEVQVFADRYGNTVYLFERDCSVQRRHQKIIEEAPAPGLSMEVRNSIGEAAVRAAKAVGYVGAGTVEFIMDKNQDFYFMEMNTRLQVEHPVSEMITGVDLVELQIRAAAGEKLPFTQDDLKINGHSFEARIYAEDPESNFMPGTGRLHFLSAPMNSEDVRIETGVKQGDEVSQFYDPMIAKLVVWDDNRVLALRKLQRKLNEYHVVGLSTNLNFLSSLSSHPSFIAGEVHTDFIEEHYADLFPERKKVTTEQIAKAVLAIVLRNKEAKTAVTDSHSPFHDMNSYQMNMDAEYNVSLFDGKQDVQVQIKHSNQHLIVKLNKEQFICSGRLDIEKGNEVLTATINGKKEKYTVVTKDDNLYIFTKNDHFKVSIPQPRFVQETIRDAVPAGGVIAPMTGTILEVRANVGAEVISGQTVAVIYAMKLEHNIVASVDGKIKEILVVEGQTVNQNDEIIKIVNENE